MPVPPPVWDSWLLYTLFSYSPQHGSLCCPWTRNFCSAEHLLANESYWRSTRSMPSSIFMNNNGCEQIPEIKKMHCRKETAAVSQEDPHWHGRPGVDPWDLLPGTWATAASTACLLGRWVRMEDSFKHYLSLTNSSHNFKERTYSSAHVACFCAQAWGTACAFPQSLA